MDVRATNDDAAVRVLVTFAMRSTVPTHVTYRGVLANC